MINTAQGVGGSGRRIEALQELDADGVPLVADVTLAVNVTEWSNADGLSEELTVVEVPALFTVCVSADEVMPLKSLDPPYTAVILLDPPGTAEVVSLAILPLSVPDPRVVAPSLKVTVPVGVPPDEVTVAVKVTAVPYVDGFKDETNEIAVVAWIAKVSDFVLSTLPATSLLWKLTVWLPSAGTVNGLE